jgi:hypothetical protein
MVEVYFGALSDYDRRSAGLQPGILQLNINFCDRGNCSSSAAIVGHPTVEVIIAWIEPHLGCPRPAENPNWQQDDRAH